MDNTMRITIPWKPGMTVMLKDGRSMPDKRAVDFLAELGIKLEYIEGGYAVGERTQEGEEFGLSITHGKREKTVARIYDPGRLEDYGGELA